MTQAPTPSNGPRLRTTWRRYLHWYEHRFLPWYTRWAPAMVITCLITVALVTIGTYANYASLEADRVQREKENRILLGCFDEYASKLAPVQTKIRGASTARDVALNTALVTLSDGLEKVGDGTFKDRDLAAIVTAFADYEDAQRALDQGRKDNPYPEPPSVFCVLPDRG